MDILRIQSLKMNCPVCAKSDWCGVSADGLFAFCPRIEEGSIGRYGAWGYIHPLSVRRDFAVCKSASLTKKSSAFKIHWLALQELYRQNLIVRLKGITFTGLTSHQINLGAMKDNEYNLIYPVYNAKREIVGMLRRFPERTKKLLRGSRDGIFWPLSNTFTGWLFITEGASDCEAALTLGYEAIGRLNCLGGIETILSLLKRKKKCFPVVIADNDKAGIDGAKKLVKRILGAGRKCLLLVSSYKDLREWYEKEGKEIKRELNEYIGKYDGSNRSCQVN